MAKILGLVLPIERGSNGYFKTTTDIPTQIRSNLTNLLLTQIGERPMQPNFGSNLKSHLFENNLEGNFNIKDSIKESTVRWMPYIQIGEIQVLQSMDSNSFKVFIPYTFSNGNVTDSITLIF